MVCRRLDDGRERVAAHQDAMRGCSPTVAGLLAELARAARGSSAPRSIMATATRTSARRPPPLPPDSGFFRSFRTTLVVENGVVVERRFRKISGDAVTMWNEVGSDVGSRTDEGHPAVALDAVYDECQNHVLTRDEGENLLDVSVHADGLLATCTYSPFACNGDCSRGPRITSVQM
jgi:hypothetical protein